MDYSINIRSTRAGWWPTTLLCLFKIHPHSLVTKPTFHFRNWLCLTLGSSEIDFRLPSLSEHSMAQRLVPRWSCDPHQANERKTWDSWQSCQARNVAFSHGGDWAGRKYTWNHQWLSLRLSRESLFDNEANTKENRAKTQKHMFNCGVWGSGLSQAWT